MQSDYLLNWQAGRLPLQQLLNSLDYLNRSLLYRGISASDLLASPAPTIEILLLQVKHQGDKKRLEKLLSSIVQVTSHGSIVAMDVIDCVYVPAY